ncbi:NAD(P)-dependent oxidoreductase [Uliginosibacterium sp. H3]|uniref:NAD(P)-dependent oxidoreductase n=1 Tax=Uliginosibacterium silvisoli TaxID=3114758 RepID=A0ABU6K2F1_9RHOO|nr:NAD(P)-dependent oxidoreductase [Uliginosibacterium sp. H3]
MKIALIGGTGFVGSAVLKELLDRGHEVVALARTPGKYASQPKLSVVQADVLDARQVSSAVAGTDAVVDAYNPGWSNPDIYNEFLAGTQAILDGIKTAGVKRVLVVGGAGSLYVAPGLQLIDTPEFPAAYKQGALGARKALNDLRDEQTLEWSFLSPPVFLAPGERSGKYRFGKDDLLFDGDKPAGISVADLAVAIVDEIEEGRHIRQRFTVAS